MTSIKSRRIITPDGLSDGYLNTDGGKIVSLTSKPVGDVVDVGDD